MNIQEISKKVKQQVRDDIKYVYDINKTYNGQFGKHKVESIHYMFKEWHNLFPKQKQDLKCSSCRNAVVKFWGMMIDEWVSVETIVKPKQKKVGKKKK